MITNTQRRHDIVGTGGAGPFSYQFMILNDTDLAVYVDGNLKTLTTHYTVSGVGNESGGTITFTSGNYPALSADIILLGAEAETQTHDFQVAAVLPAASLEESVDKLTRLVQQLTERVNRSPVLPVGDSGGFSALALPAPGDGQYLRWSGNQLALGTPTLVPDDVPAGGGNYDHLIVNGSGAVAWGQALYHYAANFKNIALYGNSLSNAVSSIGGSTKVCLLISESISVTGNITVTDNITFFFVGAGGLAISSGVTLTLPGPSSIHAPWSRQIFTGSGTVAFSVGGQASPGWFGLSASASSSTNATAVQNCMNALPSANCGSVVFPSGNYSCGNIRISGRSNLLLRGNGATIEWTGTAGAGLAIGFELHGVCSQVTIQDFQLVGDGVAANGHAGVWMSDGQTMSNIQVLSNHITDVTLGVSYSAYTSGTFTGGVIAFNDLDTIVGTSVGTGYGIHIASATGIRVFENKVNAAQRHSIYHAAGDTGCLIHHNVITNHRSAVADATYRCAIAVVRSSNVIVSHNVIRDHYDGGLEIAHTTTDALSCRNIVAEGNEFINRQNNIEDVLIGEQSVPTSYETAHIKLSGNLFSNAYASAGTPGDILVVNGRQIDISGNTFKKTGVSGTARYVSVGHDSYMSSSSHCEEVHVHNNKMYAEGSSLTDIRVVDYGGEVCTGTARHTSHHNIVPPTATRHYFNSTRTNPSLIGDTASGQRKGIYTAADTTPSVLGVTCLSISNSGPVSITAFDDGEDGQTLDLIFQDANTTIVDSVNLQLAGSANFTSAGNKTLTLVKDGSIWYQRGGSTN